MLTTLVALWDAATQGQKAWIAQAKCFNVLNFISDSSECDLALCALTPRQEASPESRVNPGSPSTLNLVWPLHLESFSTRQPKKELSNWQKDDITDQSCQTEQPRQLKFQLPRLKVNYITQSTSALELFAATFCALGELEHTFATILGAGGGSARVGQSSSTLHKLPFCLLTVVALTIFPMVHAVGGLGATATCGFHGTAGRLLKGTHLPTDSAPFTIGFCTKDLSLGFMNGAAGAENCLALQTVGPDTD